MNLKVKSHIEASQKGLKVHLDINEIGQRKYAKHPKRDWKKGVPLTADDFNALVKHPKRDWKILLDLYTNLLFWSIPKGIERGLSPYTSPVVPWSIPKGIESCPRAVVETTISLKHPKRDWKNSSVLLSLESYREASQKGLKVFVLICQELMRHAWSIPKGIERLCHCIYCYQKCQRKHPKRDWKTKTSSS